MSFVNQFMALLESDFRRIFKYKFKNMIYAWIIAPLIWVLDIILRGTYISTVDFYTKLVPYAYLLFLGIVASGYFVEYVGGMINELLYRPQNIIMYNKAAWILSGVVYELVSMGLYNFSAWIPLYILYKFPVKFLVFVLLIILVFVPFAISSILILSYFIFKLREDAMPIWMGISFICWSVFPVGFALTIFKEPLRTYLEIFFPPFGIIEEIRKLAILKTFNFTTLILSFLMSLVYLIFGILLFYKAYNNARKKGTILLK